MQVTKFGQNQWAGDRGRPNNSKWYSIFKLASLMSAFVFFPLLFNSDNLTPLILKVGTLCNHFCAKVSAEEIKTCNLELAERRSLDGPAKEFNFDVFAGGTGKSACVRDEQNNSEA